MVTVVVTFFIETFKMQLISDLHIHSKYSGGTSKYLSLDSLALWAHRKGVNLISTGDILHPTYLKEIKKTLLPCPYGNDGFYIHKDSDRSTALRFMLTGEVSNIYMQNGRMRKVHNVIFAPNLDVVDKLQKVLGKYANLELDGRPIFEFPCTELVKIVMDVSEDCLIVPAHAWTPWYSLFGSRAGFDSLEECFGDYSKYIYAIETGLDSTPDMNRQVSALDNITLLSNSDAHSPSKVGREANVFEVPEFTTGKTGYKNISEIIKTKKNFLYTIDLFPEIGKYYNDGHRNCGVNLTPAESDILNNICPKCGKLLTVGVLNRIEKLSNRPSDYNHPNQIPTKLIAPLEQIISSALGVGVKSKAVQDEYLKVIEKGKNEFNVLLDIPESELQSITSRSIANGIIKMRSGEIEISAGFDGEFGKVHAPNIEQKQQSLF